MKLRCQKFIIVGNILGIFSKMGGCASEVYTIIKKEHGEIFKKYIMGFDNIQVINEVKIIGVR